MANLIQRLKEKIDAHKYSKPRWQIQDLCVGEIVQFKSKKYNCDGLTRKNYFIPIKTFAILLKASERDGYYLHFKSAQFLRDIKFAETDDYVVRNIRSYSEEFADEMQKCKQTKKSKVSEKFINNLETEINMEISNLPGTNYYSELFDV